MVTSTYDWIIIEWDNKHTTKQTNKHRWIIIKCVNLEWRTIDALIWLVLNLSFYLILYTTEYNFLQTTYYNNYIMWFTKNFILAIVNDKKSFKCCMSINPIINLLSFLLLIKSITTVSCLRHSRYCVKNKQTINQSINQSELSFLHTYEHIIVTLSKI